MPLGALAGQHHRQDPALPADPVGVQPLAQQRRLELDAAASSGSGAALGAAAVRRRGHHDDEVGVVDLAGHPHRPVLPAGGRLQVPPGVDPARAQQFVQVPHGIRGAPPSRRRTR
jgi:hypothetical protein